MPSWIKTPYPGIRYREHPDRLHAGRPDRYYTLRLRVNGPQVEEGLGWASEGWTPKKAAGVLANLHEAKRLGQGPRTLTEARALADHAAAQDAQTSHASRLAALTLREIAAGYFIPWAKRNKRSWDKDIIRLNNQVYPAFGDLPLAAITRTDVEKFRDDLLDGGLSAASVRQCLALLRKIYNFCLATTAPDYGGLMLYAGLNPVAGIKMPAADNARVRFLTFEQADTLLALAMAKGADVHDAILLSLNTGMRKGEINRLLWQDVDFDNKIIRIPDDPQGKPGGVVYLNKDALAMLKSRRKLATPGAVLVIEPPQKGKHRRRISNRFQELVDALGFNAGVTDTRQRVVFHSLRHTFASWLALAGVDIYRIKELMRHKTIQMTMRYAHLTPGAKRAAVTNLRGGHRKKSG